MHANDPDAQIRRIPYGIIQNESKRYHHLLSKFTIEEIDECYAVPIELLIKFLFHEDKPLKPRTLQNYRHTAKYNLLHIFRYSEFVSCTEMGMLVPTSGYYDDISDDAISNKTVGKQKLTDPKDQNPKMVILPLELEEVEIFELSHDMKGHLKEGKNPLNLTDISFSNGACYNVYIDNQTERCRHYITYCDHCCRDIYRRVYLADKTYRILFYLPNTFMVMDHTSLSSNEVSDFYSENWPSYLELSHFQDICGAKLLAIKCQVLSAFLSSKFLVSSATFVF